MKTTLLFSLLAISGLLFSKSLFAQTYVSGILSGNTTWTVAESPYVVDSTITIPEGITLTIEPGVVVKNSIPVNSFEYTFFDVSGTLLAQGTAADSIVFTDFKDDAHGGDTNGDGSASTPSFGYEWRCINLLRSSGNTSVFSYCKILYGGRGYLSDHELGALVCDGASPTITHCLFSKNNVGLQVRNGSAAVVENNVFDNYYNAAMGITWDVPFTYANNEFDPNDLRAIYLENPDTLYTTNYTLHPLDINNFQLRNAQQH